MKPGIAIGGWSRLWRGQKELTMENLEKECSEEIAAAGPLQKKQIYERMAGELLKQKNHKPCAATLW
jgi:hypothetical protein